MSKSYGNTIALMADPDVMKDAIRRIVTDSTPPEQPKDPDACIEGEQHTARRADEVLDRAMTAMGLSSERTTMT
jgi:tryptophanyl-tRNA synthetase